MGRGGLPKLKSGHPSQGPQIIIQYSNNTMKITILTLIAPLPSVLSYLITFDPIYDIPNQSLVTVSCSTGSNGLITKGYTDFSSLPSFPFIGGSEFIEGYNSEYCGSYWNLTFDGNGPSLTRSIKILAIDHAGSGFNIGLTAFNTLTDENGVGLINHNASQLDASECGL